MSALSAIEAPVPGVLAAEEAARTDIRSQAPRLAVVGPVAGRMPARRPGRAGGTSKPRFSSIGPGGPAGAVSSIAPAGGPTAAIPAVVHRTPAAEPVVARRQADGSRMPVRLTRRGRAVVAFLLVTGIAVGALLIGLLASGGAQAANHGPARAGYQGMHQIVVRPGQTLWSIASAAEPTADTRVVVQEIMTANALSNATISSGQLLWIPR